MSMLLRFLALGCIAVVVFAARGEPVGAIVRRHDRPDTLYQIQDSEQPAFVDVMGQVGGTLVAPQWVLTAAHSVEGVDPFSDWRVYVGGRRYDIAKIIIPSGRVEGAVDPDFDIALLKLVEPVTDVTPVPLYRWSDEMGRRVMIIGRGDHGIGRRTGRPFRRDALLRRAFNRVDGVFEHALALVFDSPPRGDPQEGVGAAGDSGGPALIERDGVLYLAGIGSTNSGDGLETARYGTLDAYARVSAHRAWIEATIAADPPSSLVDWPPLTRVTGTAQLPNTSAGRLAAQFWNALSSSRPELVTAFFERHGTSAADAPEAQAQRWTERWREFGDQALWGFSALDDDNVVFVTHAPGGSRPYLIAADQSDKSRISVLFSGALSGAPHSPPE